MIYLNQSENNLAAAVCSRNKWLTGNVIYLWSMNHKLSNQKFRFIPFVLPPSLGNNPPSSVPYDVFCINIDNTIPEVLTGATYCGETNVHLIPGEYDLKVYEQSASLSGNTNPSLAYDVVYETLVNVVGVNLYDPTVWTGTSNTYVIYNADND
jgi:hypothetical protein